MTAKDLASLLLRVIAICFVVEGAALAVSAVAHRIESGQWHAEVVFSAILAIGNSIAGIAALLSADHLAGRLTRDLQIAESTADRGGLQAIAFSILGCYFLVIGLAQLIGIGYTLWAKPKWDETRIIEYLWQQVNLGTAISYSVGGAILLLSRIGLSNAIMRGWRVVRDRES